MPGFISFTSDSTRIEIGRRFRKRFFHFAIWTPLFFMTAVNPLGATSSSPLHHQLHIELDPDTHAIRGLDSIHLLPQHHADSSVSFVLHSDLTIDRVGFNGQSLPIPKQSASTTPQAPSTRRVVEIPLPSLVPPDQSAVLTVGYHGMIDNIPKASGGLRFVRPDDTTGHIGSNGVYLTFETFWYPTWEQNLSTFDLTLILPPDWEAVTQGREVTQTLRDGRRVSQWEIALPSEALTLAANHFVVHKEEWKGIQLATYLFPDEANLSSQYIAATIDYLGMYTDLLGPYPFTKFAVVENFFPSGLGLPSFTLLGQGIVRRGYTQPYSLGHEIVHSWFGNSVLNDLSKGNWVEGLTTYLANYYYDEATGHHQEAFNTRRRMVYEYNLYAVPDKEYPVRAFHHKETRMDNAIGYQKTALVFHMLRREVGDESFFNGVRRLIQEGTGTYLEWKNLLRIFSKAAGRDLGWFFHQWIEGTGAPKVNIQDVLVRNEPAHQGQFTMTGIILQTEPAFTFQLPLHVDLQGGLAYDTVLTVDRPAQPFTLHLPARPTKVMIDPLHHLLIRIPRAQLPPMLNKWETDPHRILIRPNTLTKEEEESLQSLVQRLDGEPGIEMIHTDDPVISAGASYLVIGSAARRLLDSGSFKNCDKHIEVQPGHITIEGQSFKGQDMAFLISCPHPDDPTHTVTFFFGWSPEAMRPVSRLLFFYGWDSYLVFKEGKVIARGMFQPVHSSHDMILRTP